MVNRHGAMDYFQLRLIVEAPHNEDKILMEIYKRACLKVAEKMKLVIKEKLGVS